jgi:uncharacterized protein (DUF2249 family)
MNPLTSAVRNHHAKLAQTLSHYVDALAGSPSTDGDGLVTFLKTEILPHAKSEESHLYPVADLLVRQFARPTATMTVDHEYISDYTTEIERTVQAIHNTQTAERPVLEDRLRRLAIELGALFKVHLAKEERVYLPLFEQHLAEGRQRELLKEVHESYQHETQTHEVPKILDVREIVPRERHPLIFGTFENLEPGESFLLVNDHDPKPLYYQFQAERNGKFSWEYAEQGPEVWRVRIGKPVEQAA